MKFTKHLHIYIVYVNDMEAHFPQLRTVVRNMYQFQRYLKSLNALEESLNNLDVDKIREFEGHQTAGSVFVENTVSCELDEE